MCLGIPGQILEISDTVQKLAIVDIGGVRRPVNIACIVEENEPVESCVGDWVLVHVGFAMNRIDPQEAQLTLDLLEEMAAVHEEMAATG
ncbi:MAG: HypC/HybG/HupF family hydrogenase formation chaperone [Leptolyngbya sp. SIO1D8]|nr:HypC/HybG/HupF family hydrogenase formation chaperone [Leptolyngbya sp. SIO1D8]